MANEKISNNNRQQDEQDEKIVAKWLDKYFYPNVCSAFARSTTKEQQIAGNDLIMIDSNKSYIIDEKCASQWANRNLKTFIHEIDFINRGGKWNIGYFVDDTKINKYYLYVWLDEAETTADNHLIDDGIKQATVVLIEHQEIQNWLDKYNFTKENLISYAKTLRTKINELPQNMDWKCVNYPWDFTGYPNYPNVKFHYGQWTKEKTINLQITKEDLIKLSELNCVVSKEGVEIKKDIRA